MRDIRVKLNAVLPWQKQHSTRRRLPTSRLDLNWSKKLAKCYIWSISFYDVETLTFQTEVPGKFWKWCWRELEKISWTDRVKNEEVLQRVKEVRNILCAIKRGKANWVYHILCRKCHLNHVIAGKMGVRIGVTGRRGRWRIQPLD